MVAPAIVLTAALLSWKAEIESASGLPLLVAEARFDERTNEFHVPAGTPRSELYELYLGMDAFRAQFSHMRATMVFHRTAGEQAFLVLLNGARRAEWEDHQEALLAHEFGHAWVKSQAFPSPVFVPGPYACLSVHTGDVTQHVLIRREMDQRGIAYRGPWLDGLAGAIAVMEQGAPPPEADRCARARLAAEWVDVRLGLQPGDWPLQPRYEAALRKYTPEISSTVEEIAAYVKAHDMAKRDEHRAALVFVFEKLKDLVYQRAKEFRLYGTLKRNPSVS